MLVSRSNFDSVLTVLSRHRKRSLDTETSGLRPYHGSRLFSIIIAVAGDGSAHPQPEAFYFNFKPYEGLPPEDVLRPSHLRKLAALFEQPDALWFLHNAKYDLAILAAEGLELAGTIHCTKAMARVEFNEHNAYDLASCAARIGFAKDDTVEKYIEEHGLWEWETIPGKKSRKKNKHYDAVPFGIIRPYGETDAIVDYHLGESQEASFALLEQAQASLAPHHRQRNIVENERALTKVVFRMEQRGVQIDIPYTTRAVAYEKDRAEKALIAFKQSTGRDFKASSKLFEEVFASDQERWLYTEKGNPSFDATVFASFENPAAKAVLAYRDAKSKHDFYLGFLYHADACGVLHPNFNPDGTRTGRFSSSDPNFQNLTAEEGLEEQEFLVRRAIIPRPGHIFFMPDYSGMEYRLLVELAGETSLAAKMNAGLDIHTATAELLGVSRGAAKTINFALVYGAGNQKLADSLGLPLEEAKAIKAKYFSALPNIQHFLKAVQDAVGVRGFLRNWAGRRTYYPNKDFAFTGPNCLIQGGCADIMKLAMVGIDKYLQGKASRMLLSVHDEVCIEIPDDERAEVPKEIIRIMEGVFPHKLVPMLATAEWSSKSFGDKIKGFPDAHV